MFCRNMRRNQQHCLLLGACLAARLVEASTAEPPADEAIGFAATLFASPRGRVGTFGLDSVPEDMLAGLEFTAVGDSGHPS